MEDVSKLQTLVLHFDGISSMTTNDYRASLKSFSSYYSIQYDNVFVSSSSYLDIFALSLITLLAFVCTGLFLFHMAVIVFSKFYLYRHSIPVHGTVPVGGTNRLNSSAPPYEQSLFTHLEYPFALPGVSIIKPLTGVDDVVLFNLNSFFHMDYPKYEIIFCVADPNDPVIPFVQTLIAGYTNRVDAKLIISRDTKEICVNPKINNMNPAYVSAKYNLVLISDVGIYMYPNTLSDMVYTMLAEEHVGLVHQVPFLFPYQLAQQFVVKGSSNNEIKHRPSIAWIHQLVYFGCWHAKMYMGAAMLGINCTTGMSCLMRKDALDSVGGIENFGHYLAEDFFFSKFFHDSGWRVRVASQPAWQNAHVTSIKQFQDRMLRWYQLRLSMVPLVSFLEPITGCFINGLLHAVCYSQLFPQSIDPVAFFFCHVLIWFLLDFLLLHQIYPPGITVSVNKPLFLAMWAVHESTAFLTLIRAVFTRDIEWRGKRYRLSWGGLATRINGTGTSPASSSSNVTGKFDCVRPLGKLADDPAQTGQCNEPVEDLQPADDYEELAAASRDPACEDKANGVTSRSADQVILLIPAGLRPNTATLENLGSSIGNNNNNKLGCETVMMNPSIRSCTVQ